MRGRTVPAATVAAAVAMAAAMAMTIAGCGLAGASSPPAPPSGRSVFATECSACHSITGHSTPRQQGGDLLHFHASRLQLVQLTREMPVHPPLTSPRLRAVVGYLQALGGR